SGRPSSRRAWRSNRAIPRRPCSRGQPTPAHSRRMFLSLPYSSLLEPSLTGGPTTHSATRWLKDAEGLWGVRLALSRSDVPARTDRSRHLFGLRLTLVLHRLGQGRTARARRRGTRHVAALRAPSRGADGGDSARG